MSITTILLDAGGVLYYRPREDSYLELFLEEHGYKLRHRSIVDRAMRAAIFDVQSGRISGDQFYNAILRLHGVNDRGDLSRRTRGTAARCCRNRTVSGAAKTLIALSEGGYRLGVVY